MSKVWMITGSSRGIGRATCEAVLASGGKLMATALERELDRIADFAERYGDQVRTMALDVNDPERAQKVVDATVAAFGRIDVLVNTAGYGDVGSIEDTSLADIRAQIETNLFGTINVTKAALPYMRKQRSGNIIQFSSIAGRVSPAGRGAYAAAKWGIEGFSEVLAKEVGPLGVKVTIIEPGGFRTDFAGASTTFREPGPDYASISESIKFQKAYDGKQPGDPAKAGLALVKVTELETPPLRLVLGSDAYAMAEKSDAARVEDLKAWKHLSVTTDFETAKA